MPDEVSSTTTGSTLDTVIFRTARMPELAAFYLDGLSVPAELQADDRHLGFDLPGGVYLGFDAVDDAPAATSAVTLWFRVDDLQATFARFAELGAEIVYEPTRKPWGDRLAALRDLDGNVFGLAQR